MSNYGMIYNKNYKLFCTKCNKGFEVNKLDWSVFAGEEIASVKCRKCKNIMHLSREDDEITVICSEKDVKKLRDLSLI